MLIRGKNEHLLDASRRRNFHGEMAFEWFVSYSLSWFSGIILTSSPYPLQFIKGEEISWRKLAWMRLAFGISLDWIEIWRLLAWLDEPLCQDRLWILSDRCSQNYWSGSVWEMKDSWKRPYDINSMVVISLSHLIWYSNMILSYKPCYVLLYDSLITYIGLYWVYAITINLVGCVLLQVHHCKSVGMELGWRWREEATFKRYFTYPS